MSMPYNCNCDCDSDDESSYPKLKVGDTIGIISPSGTPKKEYPDVEVLAEKIRNDLGVFGLKVKFAKYWASDKENGSSGTVRERLEDIKEMFGDPEVKAVMVSVDGYSAIDLTGLINYKFIEEHPKLLIGHGDVALLQMAFQSKANLRSIYGPVGSSVWTEQMKKYFCCMLMEGKQMTFKNPEAKTVIPGIAEGKLLGGETDVIMNAKWTEEQYDLSEPYIFFLYSTMPTDFEFEQVIHAMDQGGLFKNAVGLVFGYCLTCSDDVARISKIVADVFKKYPNIPSFVQANITSKDGSHILPINTKVRIDSVRKELKMIYPIVE